jgi:hypothetical protein
MGLFIENVGIIWVWLSYTLACSLIIRDRGAEKSIDDAIAQLENYKKYADEVWFYFDSSMGAVPQWVIDKIVPAGGKVGTYP